MFMVLLASTGPFNFLGTLVILEQIKFSRGKLREELDVWFYLWSELADCFLSERRKELVKQCC